MPTNDGCDLLELVPGVSGMEVAWVAVIVSGVTVVVHFFGVMRVSVVQTRIAHDQQVGDRRIDTYLELLKWADSAWGNLGEDQGILAAWEAIRLPQQFVDQTHAFASDEVNQHVAQFQAAWLELKHAMGEREVAIRQAFAEGVKTRDFHP